MVDNDIGMVLLYSEFLIMSGGEEYRHKERKNGIKKILLCFKAETVTENTKR